MPNRINVFLVEDSELFSVLLYQKLCEAPELKVYSYNSAEKALNDFYLQPDVVLMDYFLPGINGFEALKRIKHNYPETPVILISSQENPQLLIQAKNAGASDFIAKDIFSVSKITNVIIRVFQEKEARKKMQLSHHNNIKRVIMAVLAILALGIIYYKF